MMGKAKTIRLLAMVVGCVSMAQAHVMDEPATGAVDSIRQLKEEPFIYGASFPISLKTRAQIKSPLLNAIIDHDTIKARDLIERGADVNEKLSGSITPLMISPLPIDRGERR